MRRRRPSALYSVLDEEQLLDGVDLTDYPDPLVTDGSGDFDGPAEWSPDDVCEPAGSTPDRLFDRSSESMPDGLFDRSSESMPGPSVSSRRRLILGLVGALILVLLVARGLAGILASAGGRSGSRPETSTTLAGALSAVSGSAGAAGSLKPTAGPPRRSTAASSVVGRRKRDVAGVRESRPRRPARVDVPGGPGPAGPRLGVVGAMPTTSRADGPTSPPVDVPGGAASESPPPPGTPSPEQEFGFER